MEDEMQDLDPLTGLAKGKSPNRVDAVVWALSELAQLKKTRKVRVMVV